jgi:hypothetical protein
VIASDFVTVADSESVTVTSTEAVPAAVGVPVIEPVWAFKESPAGSVVPLASAQVEYVPEPPLAASWSLYAVPTVALANAELVIERAVVKVDVAPHE